MVDVRREGFLLGRSFRDTSSGLRLTLWGASSEGPLCVTLNQVLAVFFVDRRAEARAHERRAVELLSLQKKPVDALYFRTQGELNRERERLLERGVRTFESDVKPVERYLMERFVFGSFVVEGRALERDGLLFFEDPRLTSGDHVPKLRPLSFDIETDGLDGALFSIAGVTREEERIFVTRLPCVDYQGLKASASLHEGEAATLNAFFDWVQKIDPDLLLGWNVIEFDLQFLMKRCREHGVKFRIGRGEQAAEILLPRSRNMPTTAIVPGRAVLDGIATLRSAAIHFESYSLEDVASDVLGRSKKIAKFLDPVEEIRRMARSDPEALARYNLEDCRLVLDIFDKARLIEFVVTLHGPTGRVGGRLRSAVSS
jgi:DNA polymerase-2